MALGSDSTSLRQPSKKKILNVNPMLLSGVVIDFVLVSFNFKFHTFPSTL